MTTASFSDLYPFASHYHEIGGRRLHYLDEGAGEALVMLHGNPTWSFYYRRLVAEFRQTHRVIVPDHMGCGFSDKPQDYPYTLQTHIDNLESLLEEIVPRPGAKLTLVLHDWGGAIGMGYAARHPERIARIVVLNTAAFLATRIPFRINICRLPVFGPLVVRGLNAFARAALFMAVSKPERMTAAVKAGYLRPYGSWSERVAVLRFVQDIPLSPRAPSHGVLAEIEAKLPLFKDTPMLIQWGGRDWCFDLSFFESWRERFPQAEADVYADAGHYVLEDAHERIIPRLREFMSQPGA